MPMGWLTVRPMAYRRGEATVGQVRVGDQEGRHSTHDGS